MLSVAWQYRQVWELPRIGLRRGDEVAAHDPAMPFADRGTGPLQGRSCGIRYQVETPVYRAHSGALSCLGCLLNVGLAGGFLTPLPAQPDSPISLRLIDADDGWGRILVKASGRLSGCSEVRASDDKSVSARHFAAARLAVWRGWSAALGPVAPVRASGESTAVPVNCGAEPLVG